MFKGGRRDPVAASSSPGVGVIWRWSLDSAVVYSVGLGGGVQRGSAERGRWPTPRGVGGGCSSVLELAFSMKKDVTKLLLMHTPDQFLSGIGNQEEARISLALDYKSIAKIIIERFKNI